MNYFATTHTNKPSGPQLQIRVNTCDDLVTVNSIEGTSICSMNVDPILTYLEPSENREHQQIFHLHFTSQQTNIADSVVFTDHPYLAYIHDGSSTTKSKRIVPLIDYPLRTSVASYKFPDEVIRLHSVGEYLVSVLSNQVFLQLITSPSAHPLSIVTAPNPDAAIGVYDASAFSVLLSKFNPHIELPSSIQPFRFVSGRPITPVSHSFVCLPVQPPRPPSASPSPSSGTRHAGGISYDGGAIVDPASGLSSPSSTTSYGHHNASSGSTSGQPSHGTASGGGGIASYFPSLSSFTGGTSLTTSSVTGSEGGVAGDDRVTPTQQDFGYIAIVDIMSLDVVLTYKACKGHIRCIAVSPDGTLIAVASVKGTLIRVHSSSNGKLLHTFRRGAHWATVCCMAFSFGNELLAVATEQSRVIHLFKLTDEPFYDEQITVAINGSPNPSVASNQGDVSGHDDQHHLNQHQPLHHTRRPSNDWDSHAVVSSDSIPIPSSQQDQQQQQQQQQQGKYHPPSSISSISSDTTTTSSTAPSAAQSIGNYFSSYLNWDTIGKAKDHAISLVNTSISTISSYLEPPRHYASVQVNAPNSTVSDMRLYCLYAKPDPHRRVQQYNTGGHPSHGQPTGAAGGGGIGSGSGSGSAGFRQIGASTKSGYSVYGWVLLVFTTSGMCYAYHGGKQAGRLCSEETLVFPTSDDGYVMSHGSSADQSMHQQQQQQHHQHQHHDTMSHYGQPSYLPSSGGSANGIPMTSPTSSTPIFTGAPTHPQYQQSLQKTSFSLGDSASKQHLPFTLHNSLQQQYHQQQPQTTTPNPTSIPATLYLSQNGPTHDTDGADGGVFSTQFLQFDYSQDGIDNDNDNDNDNDLVENDYDDCDDELHSSKSSSKGRPISSHGSRASLVSQTDAQTSPHATIEQHLTSATTPPSTDPHHNNTRDDDDDDDNDLFHSFFQSTPNIQPQPQPQQHLQSVAGLAPIAGEPAIFSDHKTKSSKSRAPSSSTSASSPSPSPPSSSAQTSQQTKGSPSQSNPTPTTPHHSQSTGNSHVVRVTQSHPTTATSTSTPTATSSPTDGESSKPYTSLPSPSQSKQSSQSMSPSKQPSQAKSDVYNTSPNLKTSPPSGHTANPDDSHSDSNLPPFTTQQLSFPPAPDTTIHDNDGHDDGHANREHIDSDGHESSHTDSSTNPSSPVSHTDTRSSGLTAAGSSTHETPKDVMSSPATPATGPLNALDPPVLNSMGSDGGNPQKSSNSSFSPPLGLSRTLSQMETSGGGNGTGTGGGGSGSSSPDKSITARRNASYHNHDNDHEENDGNDDHNKDSNSDHDTDGSGGDRTNDTNDSSSTKSSQQLSVSSNQKRKKKSRKRK